jgi:hypothetical protein
MEMGAFIACIAYRKPGAAASGMFSQGGALFAGGARQSPGIRWIENFVFG